VVTSILVELPHPLLNPPLPEGVKSEIRNPTTAPLQGAGSPSPLIRAVAKSETMIKIQIFKIPSPTLILPLPEGGGRTREGVGNLSFALKLLF